MLDKEFFKKNILDMIDLHSYYFYLITRDLNVACSCIRHETEQANPSCKKCLGTGNKIFIRKVFGAAQESKIPITFRTSDIVLAKIFYLPQKYTTKDSDLIIDKNEVFIIHETQKLLCFDGESYYTKNNCIKKKFDANVLIKNFNEIIRAKRCSR